MKTPAAVLVETGKPVVVADLEIPSLKPGQVLVEINFSAVCHTQVLEVRGYRGHDRYLPHCLGHEGSGVVREVGPSVKKVRAGERVILSWIKGSGAEVPSTVYRWGSRDVNAGAITTFARYSIISENRVTPMPDGVPLSQAALMGCTVPTGLGVVFNTARPQPGQSLAVFGVGGVGLCAVAAASLAGCVPVIAVDIRRPRLALAERMGATHCVDAGASDAGHQIHEICPEGLDFAIESSGRPEVMRQALSCVRVRGGTAVVVGNARHGEHLTVDPWQFNLGKRLLGTWGGESQPDRDYPRYCRLISTGKLNLRPLLTKVYPLSEINQAIDDLERGEVPRPLIDMAQE